jgi:hypothetical protein
MKDHEGFAKVPAGQHGIPACSLIVSLLINCCLEPVDFDVYTPILRSVHM